MRYIVPAFLILGVALGGCPRKNQSEERLTRAEAQQALDEAAAATQADNLMAAGVEISTSFTIGQAATAAAAELRTFIEAQLPCAEVTLANATLTVEYGVNPGTCLYRGHRFSGTTSITVEANAEAEVHVHHEWTDFSNGVVTLNGNADVTWDFQDRERRVAHHAEWTHIASGRTGVGEGDRVQRPLAGGIVEGFSVDGSRSWTGARGTWDLAIDGVEMRWADPVPQAGQYTLATPFDKTLTLAFDRVDENTIAVTVGGPKGSFTFNVNSL